MYTYGWLMLMYGKNYHNIVIILQLKIKFKLKKNKDLSKWRETLYSWIEKFSSIKMSILPKLIYRFDTMLIQNPIQFFFFPK